jgi:hypothetical protein
MVEGCIPGQLSRGNGEITSHPPHIRILLRSAVEIEVFALLIVGIAINAYSEDGP